MDQGPVAACTSTIFEASFFLCLNWLCDIVQGRMRIYIAKKMSSSGKELKHIEKLRWKEDNSDQQAQWDTIADLVVWHKRNRGCVKDPESGKLVDVVVQEVSGGKPFLKSKPNGKTSDNLLSLPDGD